MKKVQWTSFWKRYDVIIDDKTKFLRDFSTDKLCKRLNKAGVEDLDVDKVKKKFNNLSTPFDKVQFYRVATFFLFNTSAVTRYLKSKSASKAYSKLVRLIAKNDIDDLKRKLGEIYIIFQWEQKPRGSLYITKDVNKINISNIKASDFTRHLSRSGLQGKYLTRKPFFYGKFFIIPFIRKQHRKETYKIIAMTKKRNKVHILIPSHSDRETYIIRSVLSSKIGGFPDVLETKGSFKSLLDFVKRGDFQHFSLNRITFKKDDNFVTAYSASKEPLRLSKYDIYEKLKNQADINNIMEMKIRHKDLRGKDTFFVGVRSFNHGDLLGSICLDFAESKLSEKQIKQIKDDFESDFGLQLKTFIAHGDYKDIDLCRIFLGSPTKASKVNIRYPQAWSIYNDIRNYGLLAKQIKSKQKKYYCFNLHCRLQYNTQWKKHCDACKSLLHSGKIIVISRISEEQIINFLAKYCNDNNIAYERFNKTILKKKRLLIQARLKKNSIVFLPASKEMSDNELEVMSLRFPNTVIIYAGTHDNKFEKYNITSLPLHNVFYNIVTRKRFSYLSNIADQLVEDRVNCVRAIAKRVEKRITNRNFYSDKNRKWKNLGAELFEADCSVLLNYIFSNSLWLGTSRRGKPLPDGISAFPLIFGEKGGCFIWDAKFSESGRLALGRVSKNKKYVVDAAENASVKQHGGLKSFIIIGNQEAPTNFKRNFKKVAKARKRGFKCTFINEKQLLSIYRYFKKYEKEILSNDSVRNAFLELFKQLFFKKKKTVVETLDDFKMRRIITENRQKINKLKSSLKV